MEEQQDVAHILFKCSFYYNGPLLPKCIKIMDDYQLQNPQSEISDTKGQVFRWCQLEYLYCLQWNYADLPQMRIWPQISKLGEIYQLSSKSRAAK